MTDPHPVSALSSALGRYGDSTDETDMATDAEPLIEVQLLNFPLQLFRQAREHHDELMREFALLALAGVPPEAATPVPARLAELIEILGRQYGAASERSDTVRDEALDRGDAAVDLYYLLPATAAASIRALNELMDEADVYCQAEQLLTMPSTDLEIQFRTWFLTQFEQQLRELPATPWSGPLAGPEPVL